MARPDSRQWMEMMQRLGLQMPPGMAPELQQQALDEAIRATEQLFQNTPIAQSHPGGIAGIMQAAAQAMSAEGHSQAVNPEAAAMSNKRVVLCNLQGSPELNGLIGTVVFFEQSRGRFRVRLDDKDKEVSLLPANIRVATDIELMPPAESLQKCLESEAASVDVLQAALQRATAAGTAAVSTELVVRATERLAVMQRTMAQAREGLRAFANTAVPTEQSARKDLAQALSSALATATAARMADDELAPQRRTLCHCLVLSLSVAADNHNADELEEVLALARNTLPSLGPEASELQREISVCEQRQHDLRAAADRAKARQEHHLPEPAMPQQFKCPITTQVMVNPVAAADGFIYERSALEEHLRHHSTSPMTREPLSSTALVQNNTMKQLIREHEAIIQEQLLQVAQQERLRRAESRDMHNEEKAQLQAQLQSIGRACAEPAGESTAEDLPAQADQAPRGAVALQLVRHCSYQVQREAELETELPRIERELRRTRILAVVGFAAAALSLLLHRR